MSEGKSERQQRLAEALRANLRRRKGQARARTQAPAAPDDGAGPAGRDAPASPRDPD